MNFLSGVVCCSEEHMVFAHKLCEELSLPLINTMKDWVLCVSEKLVSLQHPEHQPLYVDFMEPRLQYRAQRVSQEILIKACGRTKGDFLIDTTAGWGQESFLLASFGFQVEMIECSPVMGVLLQDGLMRCQSISHSLSLKLTTANSIDYLSKLNQAADVIYLDPMFPKIKGKRLSKLSMSVLSELSMPDEKCSEELLEISLQKSLKRVVVKRYGKHDYLADKKPTFSLSGRSSRFDVYCIA